MKSTGVFVCAVIFIAMGCQQSHHAQASRLLDDILSSVSTSQAAMSPVPESDVESLVKLSNSPDWRVSLSAFPLTESEYASLPSQERERLLEQYLGEAGALKGLAEAAMNEADEARLEGNDARAELIEMSVLRLAQANQGEDRLKLANLIGDSIVRQLVDSRTP